MPPPKTMTWICFCSSTIKLINIWIFDSQVTDSNALQKRFILHFGTLDRKPCYQTITAAAIRGKSKHLKAERQ